MAANATIPAILEKGTLMTKVSRKRTKEALFRIDPDEGSIRWESKKHGRVPIECVKELRFADQASFDRTELGVTSNTTDIDHRWITIIYVFSTQSKYKSLNLIAPSGDMFRMWKGTLEGMMEVRRGLMDGLGSDEGMERVREEVWERMYWRGADGDKDEKIGWADVKKMCLRLGVDVGKEKNVEALFNEADKGKTGFLDFEQFSGLVKALKRRPEVEALYKNICKGREALHFDEFKSFMRDSQGSTLGDDELQAIFTKYADPSQQSSPPPSKLTTAAALEAPVATASSVTAAVTSSNPTTSDTAGVTPAVPSQPTTTTSDAPTPVTSAASPNSPASTTPSAAPAESAVSPDPSTSTAPAPTTAPAKADPTSSPAPPPAPPSTAPASTAHPAPPKTISLPSFTSFLYSLSNAAFSPLDKKIWQDMSRPLSEYYLSTSHNTYLVGHQLMGVSTVEGYVRALLHGCRSVELDIYDGDPEPVVYHGKTLTSKVPLRDICTAIQKYAFVASPYPVIISAEVHCSITGQERMVEVLKSVFGELLVQAPVEGRPALSVLPSPEDLKGKVLLKAKNLLIIEQHEKEKEDVGDKLKKKVIAVRADSSDSSSSSSSSSEDGEKSGVMGEIKSKLNKVKMKVKNRSRERFGRPGKDEKGGDAGKGGEKAVRRESTEKPKMSFALAALLVYTIGVKCRGFHPPSPSSPTSATAKKTEYKPEHIFSLSESKVNGMLKAKESMNALIEHTRTHMVRIYPKGMRVNSTNYEPSRYWAAGAQLVAINWQTFDLGYMINMAMFYRNGKSGFVLKPLALREPEQKLLARSSRHFFDVTIISAQQLPCPRDKNGVEIVDASIVDPVVEVTLHIPDWTHSPFLPSPTTTTASPDPASTNATSTTNPATTNISYSPASSGSTTRPTSARTVTFRTASVKNNGFNPIWSEELCLPFDCVGGKEGGMMDLIFVRFVVWPREGVWEDKDERPLATYCTSLGSLERGFRHLPLHDQQMSQFLFSTLFVKVGIRDVD